MGNWIFAGIVDEEDVPPRLSDEEFIKAAKQLQKISTLFNRMEFIFDQPGGYYGLFGVVERKISGKTYKYCIKLGAL